MSSSSLPDETTLLAKVLKPLLEDFQYWFGRSLASLENGALVGLAPELRASLLERLHQAMAETQAVTLLLEATSGQAGVSTAQVMGWHALVAECWAIARRHRAESVTGLES